MRIVRTRQADATHFAAFLDLIGKERAAQMYVHARALRNILGDGTLWHVNSTKVGGGVAEILHTLVPMYQHLGIDVRWAVIDADHRFFNITKRLGNLAYGSVDQADRLADGDRQHYLDRSAGEAEQLLAVARRDDVMLLHDHQTAGLAVRLSGQVAATYWRCHVGVDVPTAGSHSAWAFLSPLLQGTSGVVFSVQRHIPDELSGLPSATIPPIIWPFSAKNRTLSDTLRREGLHRCGLNGSMQPGDSAVHVLGEERRDPGVPLVVQVSRWDRLKDMHGVLDAFAEFVPEGHLALVGPDPGGVPDDMDQERWLRTCADAWRALPQRLRRRISLVCLPMSDPEDNALLVNAVQRSADVIVQKSLAEGFGLTVTEAMWKGRPVIGSAVGGITQQIVHGHNGLLLQDPHNRAELGALINSALRAHIDDPSLGTQAYHDVHRNYLPDRDFAATTTLMTP